MSPLTWAIVLLLMAFVLFIIELFVPSGGILGFVTALCILGAVGMAFRAGIREGIVVTIIVCVMVPTALAAALKYWPHTPFGRLILIQPPKADEVLPDSESYWGLKELIGKQGVAKSKLLPSGDVLIGGKKYDAVSNGLPIETGQRVKVVAIRTQRVVVRPLTEKEARDTVLASPAEEMLQRPLDDLGIEPLDDPLA